MNKYIYIYIMLILYCVLFIFHDISHYVYTMHTTYRSCHTSLRRDTSPPPHRGTQPHRGVSSARWASPPSKRPSRG